jgi:hypothetical protein
MTMSAIPSNIQDKIRAVISNSGGEVPATQFPGLYADRWRRPFDFVDFGFAKLTAAVSAVDGVAVIPCRNPPGPISFVLTVVPARSTGMGQGWGMGGGWGWGRGRGKGKGGASAHTAVALRPAPRVRAAGGESFSAVSVKADGTRAAFHVEQKAPKRLVFSVSVDCSISMRGERIEAACAGLEEIVQSVVGDDDLFACAGFHDIVEQLHGPAPKRSVNLGTDLRNLRRVCDHGGCTALYDAIRAGIDGLKAAVGDRRTARAVGGAEALRNLVFYQVVITDGFNNRGETTLEQLKALVANPGLRNYHLIVVGVGELEGRDTRRALEELCLPEHATFQLAPDTVALREQLRWARDRIRATLMEVDRRGSVTTTVANGHSRSDAMASIAGRAVEALGGVFGAMQLGGAFGAMRIGAAAAPAAPPRQQGQRPRPKGGGGRGGGRSRGKGRCRGG